jgi:hypothetical protein
MKYANEDWSFTSVSAGVAVSIAVTVKLVAFEIVYVNIPKAVDALTAVLDKKIRSAVAILVLAIVTVPFVKTPVPMKSVTAPPSTCNCLAAVTIFKLPPVTVTSPDPDWIFTAEVVLVEPRVTVLAAAPVPMFKVVAEASVEIEIVPVAELMPIVPVVANVSAPEPDCTVVAEVEFVDPSVVVFTPAPVAILTVVAAASVLIDIAPVPEL